MPSSCEVERSVGSSRPMRWLDISYINLIPQIPAKTKIEPVVRLIFHKKR